MTPNMVMVIGAATTAVFTLRPKLIRRRWWRATVTPLASIIGSGFLVSGPVLEDVAGNWAWAAMLTLCGMGYLFGSAVRQNIALVEPMMAEGPPRSIAFLERLSGLALALAYFISVAFYLNLFASFALRAADVIDPVYSQILATGVIAILGLLGGWRGLTALEGVEVPTVGVKLALIAGLSAALIFANVDSWQAGTLQLVTGHPGTGMHEIRTLLGLVILVQGFETSRYLGSEYDSAMRIRTMRRAQLLSTGIYIVFILMVTPFALGGLPPEGGETAIIDMLNPLGTMVAPLVIFTALASQLSAAVADMNGAGGLLSDGTRGRISVKLGYLATAAVAILVTWAGDIFEIIVYASKAFVIYYGLQSVTAVVATWRHKDGMKRLIQMTLYSLATLLAVAVLVFGIPADGV